MPILTLIDITGTQSYIFTSNRLQDCVAGSELVRRVTSQQMSGWLSDPVVPTGGEVIVSGSGTAALNLVLDSGWGSDWDVTLDSISARGSGADLHYTVPAAVADRWVFSRLDKLSLTWTDPGTSEWGIEVGLIPWRVIHGTN